MFLQLFLSLQVPNPLELVCKQCTMAAWECFCNQAHRGPCWLRLQTSVAQRKCESRVCESARLNATTLLLDPVSMPWSLPHGLTL